MLWRLQPGQTATVGDILEELKDDHPFEKVSYEIGLRWFITNPGEHLRTQQETIMILPPEPLVLNGKSQALLFEAGAEAPVVLLESVDLDQPFPKGWEWLTAMELKD